MLKTTVEASLGLLEDRLSKLEESLASLEGSHDGRLGRLEEAGGRLEDRVEAALEQSRAVEAHWQGLLEDMAAGEVILQPDGTRNMSLLMPETNYWIQDMLR